VKGSIKFYLFLAGLLAMAGISCDSGKPETKPNVLFILCDDLNDWALHPADHPKALMPNLDRMAEQGVSFSKAHVSVPVCGPSRKCLFSGLHPHTINDYSFDHWAESPGLQNCTALPAHFLKNGYAVYGAGKLLHRGAEGDFYTEYGYGVDYGPHPWRGTGMAEFTPHPLQYEIWKDLLPLEDMHRDLNYASLEDVPVVAPHPDGDYPGARGWHYKDGTPFRYSSRTDRDPMPDEIVADYAVDVLRKEHEDPFFLAVGLVRTHTPLYAPQEYFDMYPLDDITLPPYLSGDREDCAPDLQNRWEWGFTKFDALIKGGGETAWKEWVQAYLACMTFVDDQIGRVIKALEASPYRDNTIIIITSDHGYHIGEKDCVQKWHLWDESTRVPLIIAGPGIKSPGRTCEQALTLINLYPTLTDLCALPAEPHISEGGPPLDGSSLRPLLENDAEGWKGEEVAFMGIRDAGEDPHFSVSTDRYRYTLTASGQEELYDHQEDPHEWKNLAGSSDYGTIQSLLREQLEAILYRKK